MKAIGDLIGATLLVLAAAAALWMLHAGTGAVLAHMHLDVLPIGRWA